MMRTLLTLLCSFLLVFQSYSQSWSPINHQIQHFELLNDSFLIATADSSYLNRYIHPIQSIIPEASYNDSLGQLLLIKRTYSAYHLHYYSFGQSLRYPLGVFYGDSIRLNSDTTKIFHTNVEYVNRDTSRYIHRYFSWSFPTVIDSGSYWRAAENGWGSFWATVDSIKVKELSSNLIDSVAYIKLRYFDDTNSVFVPNHPYNSQLVISKNNGVLKTLNFNPLIIRRYFYFKPQLYERVFFVNDTIRLTDHYDFDRTTVIQKKNKSVTPIANDSIVNLKYETINIDSLWFNLDSMFVHSRKETFSETTFYQQGTVDSIYYSFRDSTYLIAIPRDSIMNIIRSGTVEEPIHSPIKFENIPLFGFLNSAKEKQLLSYFNSNTVIVIDRFSLRPSYIDLGSSPIHQKEAVYIGTGAVDSYNRLSANQNSSMTNRLIYFKDSTQEIGNLECPFKNSIIEVSDALQSEKPADQFQWYYCTSDDFSGCMEMSGDTLSIVNPNQTGYYAMVSSLKSLNCSDTSFFKLECPLDNAIIELSDTLRSKEAADQYQWYSCTTNDFSTCALMSGDTLSSLYPPINGYYAMVSSIDRLNCYDTSYFKYDCTIENSLIIISDSTLSSNIPNAEYQWYQCLNDSLILLQNDTNQIFYPPLDGNYKVNVFDGRCPDTTDCASFDCLPNLFIVSDRGFLKSNVQNASYQWYRCEQSSLIPIDGETNNQFSPNVGGYYAIEVFDGYCTEITQCQYFDCQISDNTIIIDEGKLKSKVDSAVYQWYNCSSSPAIPIENATNQSFSPTADGNYSVEVTLDSCTQRSACLVFVGINEIALENSILIPNPIEDFLIIRSKETFEFIRIYNLNGSIVLERPFQERTDVSKLPKGIYLLEIQIGDSILRQKVIKN